VCRGPPLTAIVIVHIVTSLYSHAHALSLIYVYMYMYPTQSLSLSLSRMSLWGGYMSHDFWESLPGVSHMSWGGGYMSFEEEDTCHMTFENLCLGCHTYVSHSLSNSLTLSHIRLYTYIPRSLSLPRAYVSKYMCQKRPSMCQKRPSMCQKRPSMYRWLNQSL